MFCVDAETSAMSSLSRNVQSEVRVLLWETALKEIPVADLYASDNKCLRGFNTTRIYPN